MQNLVCIAYIGPGAGFAFVGSFFLLLSALALALLSLLSWPVRALWMMARRRSRTVLRPDVRRVVIVGLDGFDPGHYRRMAELQLLPNLQRLEGEGCFRELLSTCPPISPVAWSSFATGTNPGKHNIFDFLGRDPRTMNIELSSVRISAGKNGRPVVEGRRRSKTFWTVLGEHGVFSHIYRVPLTFPPEPFHGLMLSGLCVPDLRGTQGTFTLFIGGGDAQEMTGGLTVRGTAERGGWAFALPGPRVGGRPMEMRFRVADITEETATLHLSGHSVTLRKGVYTPWVHIEFRDNPWRKVSGLCRFCLLETRPRFRLYATPIHVDPERPPFAISHPDYYSIYLAKLHGPFATLGLAEDTWALNERVLSEAQFLEQVYDIQFEREKLFAEMLDRARTGLVVGVFEATDRIQHMFPPDPDQVAPPELDDVYIRMDQFMGRILKRLDSACDVLMVISDHGLTTFRRGVNLNTWLAQNGYLTVRAESGESGYLRDVDWARTRAYAFGLGGLYLNRVGRESGGVVTPDDIPALKREISARLLDLRDPATGARVVRAVYDTDEIYRGPYRDNAPDLIVGFERGYRVSWDGAVGKIEPVVVSDNPKHWKGDHCVDYRLVPGVFFCNRKIRADGALRLMDIAPSVLKAFGIHPPGFMDGKAFEIE